MSLPAILVNFNYIPTWLDDYDLDVTIYDRSERIFPLTKYGKVFRTRNMGDVDYDKLGYLIEHYDNLPEIFLWGKTNIFKYVDKETLDNALQSKVFTPLLKKDHKTYSDHFGQVCYYQGPMYYERADSWYFNAGGVDAKYFKNWHEWCIYFGLPMKEYVPFAPGGNYLLTRDRVHRYSRDFYQRMRDVLPHSSRPAEAQAAERSYFMLWQ